MYGDHTKAVANYVRACSTVDRSICIDPLVCAIWIDPPLDALERSTKTKMADFHKKILSVILSEIDDNVDMTGHANIFIFIHYSW